MAKINIHYVRTKVDPIHSTFLKTLTLELSEFFDVGQSAACRSCSTVGATPSSNRHETSIKNPSTLSSFMQYLQIQNKGLMLLLLFISTSKYMEKL